MGLAPLFPGCKLILPGEGLTQPSPAQGGARRVGHSPAQPEPLCRRGTEGEEGRREERGTLRGDAWLRAARKKGWVRIDEPAERTEGA